MVLIYSSVDFFSLNEVSHFSGVITFKVNRMWVHCARDSFSSFFPIVLNFYIWFGHGLKMCIWFGYYPQIIILLFSEVELSHFMHLLLLK